MSLEEVTNLAQWQLVIMLLLGTMVHYVEP